MLGRNDGGDELTLHQQGKRGQSWEQRFQDIQQELGHMKEDIQGRAPVSMDALVQQMESPFTAGVLHFPLPKKFIMLQIEAFDGTKDHLVESFQVLKDYKMKLNLTKCTFGVSAGKFLGFIVNNRIIEANPDKIKAVLDMQLPPTLKKLSA